MMNVLQLPEGLGEDFLQVKFGPEKIFFSTHQGTTVVALTASQVALLISALTAWWEQQP